jgi:hypothetical protein
MAGTTLKICNCKGPGAEFQERIYGKGMRLHNVKEDGKGSKCTVCGDKKK